MDIRERPVVTDGVLFFPNLPPLIGRLFAARGVTDESSAVPRLNQLIHFNQLGGIDAAVNRIIQAIRGGESIIISGDYDCDGATATTVAVRGLRLLGAARVGFTIPDRFKHGYGLTPGLIDDLQEKPALIITVDSGVASLAGVAHAKSLGIDVVVTDHHLPGDELPKDAVAIVNPNLTDDPFPSKALAGVGVMFYVLMAVRAKLREEGFYMAGQEPDLMELMDIVAMGTVADLVPLDINNRRLVKAGIKRINEGKAHAGIKALIEVAGRTEEGITSTDIGFLLAPRLNAAGRLENMRLGVELLLCDDAEQARVHAHVLDSINRDRKELQASMLEEAQSIADDMHVDSNCCVVVYRPNWHAGIVGLVASKLKDAFHRPTIALAPGEEGSGMIHGSGRSIPGFHLRDALALVDVRHPGLLVKFGGHAMAAGVTLRETDLATFHEAFEQVVAATLDPKLLEPVLWTDGPLQADEMTLTMAKTIQLVGPWGQAFPSPVFDNVFRVMARSLMGKNHVRYQLAEMSTGRTLEAVQFNAWQDDVLTPWIRCVYSLSVNVWNQRESLQLLIDHAQFLDEEPRQINHQEIP